MASWPGNCGGRAARCRKPGASGNLRSGIRNVEGQHGSADCRRHDTLSGPGKYAAVSDSGSFAIANVKPGIYRLNAAKSRLRLGQ